jgi:membrane-associated phospholipid phosphatase
MWVAPPYLFTWADRKSRSPQVNILLGVVNHDAFVACWDAKYAYWRMRPFQADSGVVTLFATPNHPSYPAAHGCNSASMATMLAYLFPDEANSIWDKANDNAWSRMWAGIHFRTDIDAGLALGRAVGELVVDHARHDGA